MALKYVLESLDGVEESVKALYAERDGKFYLDVDGAVDKSEIAGLEASRDRVLKEKKALDAKIKEHEAEMAKVREEAAKEAEEKLKAAGDVKGLTESYNAKVAELEKKYLAEIKARDAELDRLTVESTAMRLAEKYALPDAVTAVRKLITPRFQRRVSEDGKSSVVVVDEYGQATAYTVEEFEKQMKTDQTLGLSRLLVGGGANGGGASGSNGGDGVPAKKDAKQYTGVELKKLRQDNPQEYERVIKELHTTTKK